MYLLKIYVIKNDNVHTILDGLDLMWFARLQMCGYYPHLVLETKRHLGRKIFMNDYIVIIHLD